MQKVYSFIENFLLSSIINIPNTAFKTGIQITPYWTTLDGTKVSGVSRYARVEDGYLNIVNVPVRLYSVEEAAAGYLEVAYDGDKFAYVGADTGNVFAEMETADDGSGRVRFQQNTMFGTTIREAGCPKCNATGKIIKEKCPDCNGKGYEKSNKTIKVKFPAGIDNGQTLRMKGEGNAPVREGINGDLNIKVNVTPHKILVRKGNDLYMDLYLPFTTTLLGGKVDIPTLDGVYQLNIPELTASGTVMRIKNKGVKVLNRDSYGDLLVTIKAEVPKSLDKSVKAKLEDLASTIGDNSYTKYNNYLRKMK